MKENVKRDTNFELLRIISMIMVITIHYILCNKVIVSQVELKNTIFLLIYTASTVCINCYILISGYYLINSKFKIKKLVNLWALVLFYSISIYCIYINMGTNQSVMKYLTRVDFLKMFSPILNGHYWFITVYLVLYIIFPILNKIIKSLSRKQLKFILMLFFILLSVLSTITPDMYSLEATGGKSLLWFIFMYTIGAYISMYKSEPYFCDNKYKYLILYLLVVIIEFIIKFLLEYFSEIDIIISAFSNGFTVYNSIGICIASISLFLYFKNLKIENKYINNIINFTAPSVFPIYLIHEHIISRATIWRTKLGLVVSGANNYILHYIVCVLIVFIICLAIEKIRMYTVKFILKIPKLKKLREKSNLFYDKISEKINELWEIKS